MICWKCHKEIQVEKVFRTSECPFCHADLHSCRACDFYAPGNHFECKESVQEVIADKEKANFCDFFRAKSFSTANTTAADKADKAKAMAAALFGEASISKPSVSGAALFGDSDSKQEKNKKSDAKSAFDSLFGGS